MPRRHSQPQASPTVDWSNPLARKLRLAVIATPQGLIEIGPNRYRSVAGTAPSVGTGKQGVAALFTGTQHQNYAEAGINNACSLVVACRPSTIASVICMSSLASGNGGCEFRFNSGKLSLVNAGVAELIVTGSASVAANEDCVVGAVYTSGRQEVWKNGVLIQAATSTNVGSAAGNRVVGQRGNGTEFFQGAIYVDLEFAGALSQDEMRSLTANPWQVFKVSSLYPLLIAGAASFVQVGSGGFSMAGAAAALNSSNYAATATGGVQLGGAAGSSQSSNYAAAGSGGLALAGASSAAAAYAYSMTAAGGLALGGAAACVRSANFAMSSAGGFVLGGTGAAQIVGGFDFIGSGGLALSGVAGATFTAAHAFAGSGGIQLGGSASASAGGANAYVGSGGVSLGGVGAATAAYAYQHLASGGFALSGAAIASADTGLPTIESVFYRYVVPGQILSFAVPGGSLAYAIPGQSLTYSVP